MNCLKVISKCGLNLKKSCKIDRKILQYWKIQHFYSNFELSEEWNLSEDEVLLNKIVYNEVLQKQKTKVTQKSFEPIFLKYLKKENHELKEDRIESDKDKIKENVHFPYEVVNKFSQQNIENSSAEKSLIKTIQNFTPLDEEKIEIPQWGVVDYNIMLSHLEKVERWAYEDERNGEADILKFGSCNPDKPVSYVPCGGCGALLHCTDPALPGFIPAEIFESKKKTQLSGEICQRCNFLKVFDVALGVNVSPLEYSKLITKIKEKQALIIIMIDMLDFPCSIFPGILELIGSEKPVVIIGNKVDLFIQEGPNFLKYFKEALVSSLKQQKVNLKNVKHIFLISAKTGFGIENLISVLHHNWGTSGDVYLIGCTNVGKSSLFNALIQSDYCKVKAVNLMQRATVSAWPGTTLNLLKFPIMKTQEWRLIVRSKRVRAQMKEEKALQKCQSFQKNIRLEQIPLQGFVGKSFPLDSKSGSIQSHDVSDDTAVRKGINLDDPDFARNNWFHDTPGVLHKDQIINYLTTSELLLTVPKKMLFPRNFHLKPGYSLFIGGIARLDYISGADFVWFTVFASMELPITVVKLIDADYVYQKLLGSPFFRVPAGGKERLAKWPSLLSKKFEIYGKFPEIQRKQNQIKEKVLLKAADVDVVLSSAGWVSINVPISHRCNIEAWTPERRGIYLRNFPIIKYGHTFKGEKISKTPAYKCNMEEIKGYSLNDSPPF